MVTRQQFIRISWMRVIVLAIAAFIFNTTEFVPIALLSDIARSFDLSVAKTGLMITIYAWIVALMSLPLMLATSTVERRKLLGILFIVFILSHILSCFAWNFKVLLISRAGIAFAHAIFWSITVSLAIRVAPAGNKAQAMSLIATGTALAMVLGMPIGHIVGQYLGWRITFLAIGVAALFVMFALLYLLPILPSKRAGSLKSLPIIFKRKALVGIFILVAVVISANYTVYSYIEPFVSQIGLQSQNFITFILLAFGVAGIFGSVIFSKYSAKIGLKFLPLSIILLSFCLICLLFVVQNKILLILVIAVWGVCNMCAVLGMQVKVFDLGSDATDVSMSIFSGIFNIGIGAGALMGNQVINYLGLSSIGFIGAIFGSFAFLWCVYIFIKYKSSFTMKVDL